MFDFNDPDEVVTLESLTRQHGVISMEAMGLGQTFSAVTAKLPRFAHDVKSFLTTTLNPFAPKTILVDSRKLESLFRQVDYVKASPLSVYVPAGFAGYWTDYIDVLENGQAVLNSMQSELIKPFEMWLGLVLNSPDMLKDLTPPAGIARFKAPDLEKLRKDFGRFNTGTSNTESTYGRVVKRHADIPLITRDLNNVNQHFASISRADLIKQVTSITKLLDTLLENAKRYPEEYQVSGPNAKLLADMTYYVAQEISFYTTFGYFLEAFTRAVDDSYKRLVNTLSS